jgi:hypothetical protein
LVAVLVEKEQMDFLVAPLVVAERLGELTI